MPRYAQIKCNIYDDLVNEGFSKEAIDVYLFYSITSQNLIGCYCTVSNRDRVSANMDRVSWEKGKAQLQEKGKILWENGWVWIVGKAKFVKGEKQIRAARICFSEIPDKLKLKSLFVKRYDTLSIGNPLQDAPIPIPIPIPKPKRNPTNAKAFDRKPRSDSNTPLQKEKDKAVESFEKKFPGCKQRTWGLMHNILMGEEGFKNVGATDIKVLLELIDRIPKDIRDPVSRLTDMVQKAPSYLP